MKRPYLAGLTLAAAALAYRSCIDYLFFGRLKDDAWYWLASTSLLSGRYVDLAHPRQPPLSAPMPGFPLLLLPAAALGSPRGGQWINLALTVGAAGLAMRLLRRDARAGLAAAALAALNPLTVLQATPVMTDPAFFFFSTGALAALAIALERPGDGRRAAIASAFLAAAAAWMRPEGLPLLAASALVLLGRKEFRPLARPYLAVAAPLAASPYLWIAWRAGAGDYLRQFGSLSPEFSQGSGGLAGAAAETLRTIGDNARFYAETLTTRSLLSWVYPIPGESSWAARAAQAGLLALLGWQGVRASREGGVARLIAAYLGFYIGLHLLWVNQFRRYAFPILPLLYWLALRPLERRPRALAAATGVLLAGFLTIDVLLARQSRTPRPYDNVPPAGTFEWLRAHTRPGDVLAGGYREMFAYYTGRPVLELSSAADRDEWFDRLVSERVRYVVYQPGGERVRTVRRERFAENARTTLQRLSDPARFRVAYHAPGEPFVIYEVLAPARGELERTHHPHDREHAP